MAGPLSSVSKNVKGNGAFAGDSDSAKFPTGSTIPSSFGYWRFPDTSAYTVSPPGHPSALRLKPSFMNITDTLDITSDIPITLIIRRQADTLFKYSVDFSRNPKTANEENGVSLLTQLQHIDLMIVLLPSTSDRRSALSL
ncbi:hypothetical protein BJ878DRAFT_574074 [Calycina marina]|uniref:Uncharacterized protein n=1 Tax=Calycina marina TaxID=1763456 RepID=A0A9P7Z6S6_9HELO|nr:hypothetical protein BJ878DRAFT_574074 [Calycina marina]